MNYRSIFVLAFVAILFSVPCAGANAETSCSNQCCDKNDDTVAFTLSAEDWVTTKTALVTVNVNAAVKSLEAANVKAEMLKAVNKLVKTDWKLTFFDRSQDASGLENWNVSFEARVPENALDGLVDAAKKASKAGMAIRIANIAFTPAAEEIEAAYSLLREKIFKQAVEQLAILNKSIPSRKFRIANISFAEMSPSSYMRVQSVHTMNSKAILAASAGLADSMAESGAMSGQAMSHKLSLSAHVVFAASPSTGQ